MLKDISGQKVPQVTLPIFANNQWQNVTTDDLFKGKTVVVFSLPGAFTPTCSSTHLPRFNELASTFKASGVDDILCFSVNDSFVMSAWEKDQEAQHIRLIPDGTGEFTHGMGMLVDKSKIGFGKRSWRYSMLVKDGVIEKMFIEPEVDGDPFEVSDADTMLDYINPEAVKPKAVALFTKPNCPYCQNAKRLLAKHNMQFEEIVIGKDASSTSLKAMSGRDTVPQIFIGGQHIGGSEDLEVLLNS